MIQLTSLLMRGSRLEPGLKKNPPAAKDSSTDGLPNPVPTPKGKDAAQKQENFKPQFARKESVAGKKGGKDDDSDDPIAKSLALRIKAGGISEVISQAEAKKLGLIKTTVTAPADKNGTKPTSNATTDKKAPGTTAPANGTTEEKKQGTAVKDNKISKPAPAIQKGTGFGGDKKKGAADEADPIEESLKLRIKAGGLTEVVPLDKKAAAAQATKKDAPKTAEKKEEKKEAPKTTAPATQTKVQSPTTNTTATTDKTKNSVDDAKRRQSVGTASTLTNVPKVMKGKKKNEDSEKKDDENEATVSTHQNAQGEDQINSQADDDTKQSLNGEATGDVENNHTENNAEEEVEAQEEEQPKEEQQEQEEDPYERQEQVDEQVQEQEEEQQVAEQQEAEQNGHNQAEEVDLEQVLSHVLELQSLLDQTKPSNVGLEDLKLKGAEIVKSLRDQLLAAVQDSETQAKASGADGEKQVDPSAFQTSKNTNTCCIEFLQENDVETASWIDEADGHDKLKKILKVFFSLISTYNSESWCSFPTILNDDLFYAGAKQALLTDAVTLSPFFTNCLKNLDLSNENLLKVSLLLSHFDDLKEDLDPAQSVDDENQAELNMTFFLYVIKDILEYFGMYPTTSAGRQQQHALTRAKLFKTKSDYLTRVLAQLE
ncbi:UNKNOWN [Stylonychia lemnae]|uniref:Uncharacterized protein n=1 Tax=Stylonychia lemnae TaxID=5949 RepID=A0A077ZP63_STYLE|nr:UNKNOWN [Stylonychia lemnae]|eukprot:CDW71249.1 UNKNOWN [Stylonychia lemnae]